MPPGPPPPPPRPTGVRPYAPPQPTGDRARFPPPAGPSGRGPVGPRSAGGSGAPGGTARGRGRSCVAHATARRSTHPWRRPGDSPSGRTGTPGFRRGHGTCGQGLGDQPRGASAPCVPRLPRGSGSGARSARVSMTRSAARCGWDGMASPYARASVRGGGPGRPCVPAALVTGVRYGRRCRSARGRAAGPGSSYAYGPPGRPRPRSAPAAGRTPWRTRGGARPFPPTPR